ncbi:MAG: rod shape-determining protein MreC [Bacteroidetes bacterium]|nr:rod shape-determining protein MreC [Bacteroidota bacterium]MDF2451017.1 rod shape-determining protein MreC [Bacteroidota bacterium]
MKNLLNFLYRNNFFFVFLFLEFICFLILIKNNGYQGSSLLNSSNKLSAKVYEAEASAKEYLLLKDENERLAKMNTFLLNRIKLGYAAIPLKTYKIRDTLYKQEFEFMSGKAINNSVNKRNNYLTLNVGSDQGVTNDMAVITSNGIVGIVKDVSKNFSSVMSILHKDVRVNCQLKKDGSYGPLIWDGSDYRFSNLTDIPTHAKIKKGDTVITSSLSGIFPEGIMVGFVESFEQKPNESYFTVKVKLSADFKKVNHVSVIKYNYKTERDSLEIKSQVQSDK